MIIQNTWAGIRVSGQSGLLEVSLEPLREGGIIVAQTVPHQVAFHTWLDRDDATALRDWLTQHLADCEHECAEETTHSDPARRWTCGTCGAEQTTPHEGGQP